MPHTVLVTAPAVEAAHQLDCQPDGAQSNGQPRGHPYNTTQNRLLRQQRRRGAGQDDDLTVGRLGNGALPSVPAIGRGLLGPQMLGDALADSLGKALCGILGES